VFSEAKFDLRGWEYSDPRLENHHNAVVLGLTWDRKADTLAVSSLKTVKVEVVTRRIMLSMAQQVFDPIGFTCPVSLSPKLLLQKCWEMEGEWDQVPENVRNEFLRWLRDLPLLEEVKIPRWLRGVEDSVLNCSLHTFCDASKSAYAAAVFVRTEYNSSLRSVGTSQITSVTIQAIDYSKVGAASCNDRRQVSSFGEDRD